MASTLLPSPKFFLIDNNGNPAVGWKIHTYEPGTVVEKETYTDSTEAVANTNPVILDARGEADIWWQGEYKIVVKDADDATIYTVDNYKTATTFPGSIDIAAGGNITIDRTTEDAAFMNLKATVDADAVSAISSLTTSGAVTHHIQIELNGVTAWIPCSTTDPT